MNNRKFIKQSLLKDSAFKITFFLILIIGSVILYFTGIGCVWRYFFNVHCPGCGITRAYLSLFKGELLKAFEYHFMFPFVPVVFLYILFNGKLFRRRWLNTAVLIAVAAGFFIRWIIYFVNSATI